MHWPYAGPAARSSEPRADGTAIWRPAIVIAWNRPAPIAHEGVLGYPGHARPAGSRRTFSARSLPRPRTIEAMSHETVGIDIGSTSLKLCVLSGDGPEGTAQAILPHEGDLEGTLARLLEKIGLEAGVSLRGVVTGTEGRYRVRFPDVIAAVTIERALKELGLAPRAVVSMGGEDLVVYVLDGRGRIVNTYAGNKCASGTGEFLRQQLGRMDLRLEDINEICEGARVHPISAR